MRGAAELVRPLLVTIILWGPHLRRAPERIILGQEDIVTFNDAGESPGAVLPARDLVSDLAESISQPNIVQILEWRMKQVLATDLTNSKLAVETRLDPISIEERPGDSPQALKYVLYGEHTGEGIHLFPLFDGNLIPTGNRSAGQGLPKEVSG